MSRQRFYHFFVFCRISPHNRAAEAPADVTIGNQLPAGARRANSSHEPGAHAQGDPRPPSEMQRNERYCEQRDA